MIDTISKNDGKLQAFIAMDFDPHFEPVYEKVIRATVEEYGFECVRGDELRSIGVVIAQVVESIDRSDLIICEVTSNNPNVFFELGIASARNKSILLVAQKNIEIPFNIQHLRFLLYEDDKFGFLKLRKDILETLAHEFPKDRVGDTKSENVMRFTLTKDDLTAARRVLTVETSSVDEKKYAVQLLGDNRDEVAYRDIQNTARLHSDPHLRRDSYTALYKINPKRALTDLRYNGLLDWWYLVRQWAVMLIGNYQPTEGLINDIRYKLDDDSWGVQVAACRVLGKWEAVESLDKLRSLVYSPFYPVRVASEAAVEKLEKSEPHPVRKQDPQQEKPDTDETETSSKKRTRRRSRPEQR